jgi:hypothetical protein
MRPAIGLIAITLLVVGAISLAFGFGEGQHIGGPCLRMGIAMGLVWLSEPQLRRLPRWLPFAVIAAAIVLALRPKLLPLVVLAAIVAWVLRPRSHKPRP